MSDSLDGPPNGDWLTQFVGGILAPIAVAAASLWLLFCSHTKLAGFAFFLGCFMHFHYFWGLSKYWIGISVIGKNAAAGGMITCIGFGCWRFAEAFVG